MMQNMLNKIKNIDANTENIKNISDEILDHLRINVSTFDQSSKITFSILFFH